MNKPSRQKLLDSDLIKISEAKHHDPFSVLGLQNVLGEDLIRVYLPYAESVSVGDDHAKMARVPDSDFFELNLTEALPEHYTIHWQDKDGAQHTEIYPYSFPAILPEFDRHLFAEGQHWHIYQKLGAHLRSVDNIPGVYFAVWAPNAQRVSVVGEFNRWDGRCHPMRSLGGSGIWELFIPGLSEGCMYKFEILNRQSGQLLVKTDPYGQQFEFRPQTAAIVTDPKRYQWSDQNWISNREQRDWLHSPLSIYEVHLGSWQRDDLGNFLNYRQLAEQLVSYVKALGFTH
ncbi:MAG: 1,4-alpha-glucan branching enzyme, partial [Methylococcaceae bacterium]|nr:1,4-alpha-glucan branching enzyme [Methylococcaceae bacterium]